MTDDLRAYAWRVADEARIDPTRFIRQIDQESGFNPAAYNAASGASGIAQIVPRFHPDVDPWDPIASLDYAAFLMKSHLNHWSGDLALALASYNAGRQATTDGLAGKLAGWPYAETVRYVANIMEISQDEARRRLTGQPATPEATVKLSEVLARARSRTGDPYVWGGKAPGGFDCSGLVAWAYDGKVPSFTDAILAPTTRVETPAPGDLVLYEYADASQPGVRFPHVELFLSDARSFGARFGAGVGEHDQLPRSQATRYYRRLPGVVVDTDGSVPAPEPPATADPRDAEIAALREQLAAAHTTIGYLTHDVADALQAAVNTLKAHAP